MKDTVSIAILGMVLGACASTPSTEIVAADCEAVELDVVVAADGQLSVNGVPGDRSSVREAAQRKAEACQGQRAQASLSHGSSIVGFGGDLQAILYEELPNLELDGAITVTSASYPRGVTPPPRPPIERRACDAMLLNIVVTDDEELRLNRGPSTLEALRLHARNKAVACEGVTPRGSYEGPNHVTVMASMIWPILREELPDLELEMRHRRPGGRPDR